MLGGDAPDARAAACPTGLTVAGTAAGTQGPPLQVTGADCVTQGGGAIAVLNPHVTGFGGVAGKISVDGTMILAGDRSTLTRAVPSQPVVMRVDGDPVLTGAIEIKDVTFCDLAPPGPGPPFQFAPAGALPVPQEGEAGVNNALPQPAGCRLVPGLTVPSPTVGAVVKLLGLDAAPRPGQVPFLIDNERGGRIAGVLPYRLPVSGSPAPAIGLLTEVSATLGTQLLGVAGQYQRGFTIPGTDLAVRELALTVTPAESRFGGPAAITLGGFRARGEFEVAGQRISKLSAIAGAPAPGVAVLPPNFYVSKLEAGLQTGSTVSLGGTATWALQDATSGLRGTMAARFGSGAQLAGSYCLSTPRDPCTARLDQSQVVVRSSPFRFEHLGAINVLSGRFAGSVAGGATLSPFHVTYTGNLTVRVPAGIPIVGGQTVAGASSAVSERGAAALIRIPNPAGEDPTVGFATSFTSPFSNTTVSSLSSVTTVGVTAAQAGRRTLRLRRPARRVLVEVVGARRAPRSVRLRSAGRRLRATRLPGRSRRSAAFVVARVPAGTLQATSRDRIARVRASRIGTFPYLDPSPGFGTRPRPTVTAGTPVRVCWNVRGAGRGLRVDLLEDQNGRVANGRTIAADRPAKGCFAIPTAGFEPGRHWVYGVVHRGGVPISARYWPIGIAITDPAALPAPGGLAVTPTADGASVSFGDVPGAAYYVIRAEPAEPGAAAPVELQAASGGAHELSLRGARAWNVTAQAAGGNLAGPLAVTPGAGVVLAGTPNGLARVGRPWAFQLETANVTRLRLVSGPRRARLSRTGLLRWTPRTAPARFAVEGCSADARCVTRELTVTPYATGRIPFGPIRGFQVLEPVVRPGQRITLIAQGVRGRVFAKVDGRRVRARRLDSGSVRVTLPRRLARGAHDLSLRIGGNAEETAPGAIVRR